MARLRAQYLSAFLVLALALSPLVAYGDLIATDLSAMPIQVVKYDLVQEWFDGARALHGSFSGPLALASGPLLLNGTIAVVEGSTHRFENIRTGIIRAQSEGALAVLLKAPEGDSVAGRLHFFTQGGTTEYIEVPCFSLLSTDFAKVKLKEGVTFTLNTEGTTNAWREASENIGIISIYQILAALSAALSAYAIRQLVKYLQGKLGTFDLAMAALGFDIVGLVITTIAWALDPSGIRRLIPYVSSPIMASLSFTFLRLADLIVLLYWMKLLAEKKHIPPSFSRKAQIPLLILIGIIIVLEIVCDSARPVTEDAWPNVIPLIDMIVVLFVLAVMVLLLNFRLKKHDSAFQASTRSAARVRRTTKLMLVIVGLYFAFVIALIIRNFINTSPFALHGSTIVVVLLHLSITVTQLRIFSRRNMRTTNRSSKKRTDSKDSGDDIKSKPGSGSKEPDSVTFQSVSLHSKVSETRETHSDHHNHAAAGTDSQTILEDPRLPIHKPWTAKPPDLTQPSVEERSSDSHSGSSTSATLSTGSPSQAVKVRK